MKYEGFREVKCVCYPNNYVVIRKRNGLYNTIIVNLIICLAIAFTVIIVRLIGGGAEELLRAISGALGNGA